MPCHRASSLSAAASSAGSDSSRDCDFDQPMSICFGWHVVHDQFQATSDHAAYDSLMLEVHIASTCSLGSTKVPRPMWVTGPALPAAVSLKRCETADQHST